MESLEGVWRIMSNLLEYKRYIGSVEFNSEDEVFHGKLEEIRDLVSYEATDVEGLKRAFHEAVDDYLAMCEKKAQKAGTGIQRRVQRASSA
ncbi:MAG TPA: hypothetical protein VGK64_12950 [Bryobacteraceae bacterium]